MKAKKKNSKAGKSINSRVKRIVWEDAVTLSNASLEDILEREPELVETYGKIVHSNRDYVIVMTHNSHGDSNDYIRIPQCLIKKDR